MALRARRFFFMRCNCAPCVLNATTEGAQQRAYSCGGGFFDALAPRCARPVRPRPSDVLDPLPHRCCSAPRWFIDHWAYCVLPNNRAAWPPPHDADTLAEVERAFATPAWWESHPWPGQWPPRLFRTPDNTRCECVTCWELRLCSDGAMCVVCDEFMCVECVGARCSSCHDLACDRCAVDDYVTCAACNARVCSTCAQDWIAAASSREDEGREDEEYVCATCV